ncbi:MAG TPA: PEP/pyruvate-binding domain-containing protein [Candidatus Acidoferrum sp.]|nr:PEP/pyruvate-binding domain-containing protein [Candidatus Acidoferrum sp.]
MGFTRHLSAIGKGDIPKAGGKGASLSEMINFGVPVPPGFVILSSAFDNFLEEKGLERRINGILSKVDGNSVKSIEKASKSIKSAILKAEIPDNIKVQIAERFKELKSTFVAVRSSATAEDSAATSWAGQLETYLNTTPKTLMSNVKRCWASLYSTRAISYRFENRLHRTKISVAVVVQKMIESECSGVAFSAHPVTQNRDQIVIEAGYGLGEAVVSGQITPDNYVVDKKTIKIVSKEVSQQEKALVRAKAGSNHWVDIKKRGSNQKLSDKEIIGLSRLVSRIEDHYGFPCDIEWAMEKGKLYITQSRPITTLTKSVAPKAEGLGNVIKILEEYAWKLTWHGDVPPLDNIWQRDQGWVDQLNRIGGFSIKYYIDFFNGPVVTQYDPVEDRKDVLNTIRDRFQNNSKYIPEGLQDYNRLVEVDINGLKLIAEKALKAKNMSTEELIRLFETSRKHFTYNSAINSYCEYVEPALSPILGAYLTNRLSELGKEKEVNIYLTKLTTPLKPTEFSLERDAFFKMLDKIKERRIESRTLKSKEKFREYIEKNHQVKGLLLKHLKNFDWLLIVDNKPMSFENLEGEIYNYIIRKESDYSIERQSLGDLLAKGPALEAKKVIAELKPSASTLSLINGLQEVAYIRTQTNVIFNKSTYLMIPFYTEIARRLNISYAELKLLFPDDIIDLLKTGKPAKELIKERAPLTVYVVYGNKRYLFTGADAQTIQKALSMKLNFKKEDAYELKGTPVNLGVAKGNVKVLMNSKQASKILNGEILVAKTTTVSLVPAMRKAAAILTETGGITSHAAIVSRELGVPCIVGVENATTILKDGDFIEVNADNGTIKIIKRGKS